MNGWSPRLSDCYPVTGDNENISRYCTNKVVDINTVWKNAGGAAERGFALFSPFRLKNFFGNRDKKSYREYPFREGPPAGDSEGAAGNVND